MDRYVEISVKIFFLSLMIMMSAGKFAKENYYKLFIKIKIINKKIN